MIPIITIQGPTASGKSDLAVNLCKALDTELISADSRQVYKYMDIGTAKPEKKTQQEVRHHLIDIIEPTQKYSTGNFLKDSEKIIEELHQKGKIPIICGGSMLYIKNLISGISEIPDIPDDVISFVKQLFEEKPLDHLYKEVLLIDKFFAERISPTDKQRISRALEVWYAFKRPLSDFWNDKNANKLKYKPFQIFMDIDRIKLYDRINKRMQFMINKGLIEEIYHLLTMGYKHDSPGFKSVGYAEFLPYIVDKQLQDINIQQDVIDLAAQHTRNYAKRQLTWYKKLNFEFAISTETINISYMISIIRQFFDL